MRIGGGSYSLYDGFVALDAPFTDTLKARFSSWIRQRDGYVTRPDGTDLGDTDTYTAMTKLVWTPSDRFKATAAFDYTEADESGSPLVFAEMNEAATFPRVASLDAGCPGLTDVAPPFGLPEQVKVHDFMDKQLGKAIPYGVYDLSQNEGWMSVGIDHDTARFAVQAIGRWWQKMGAKRYPRAKELLITADGGGSNGSRCRLWKVALQELALRLAMPIRVSHFRREPASGTRSNTECFATSLRTGAVNLWSVMTSSSI